MAGKRVIGDWRDSVDGGLRGHRLRSWTDSLLRKVTRQGVGDTLFNAPGQPWVEVHVIVDARQRLGPADLVRHPAVSAGARIWDFTLWAKPTQKNDTRFSCRTVR